MCPSHPARAAQTYAHTVCTPHAYCTRLLRAPYAQTARTVRAHRAHRTRTPRAPKAHPARTPRTHTPHAHPARPPRTHTPHAPYAHPARTHRTPRAHPFSYQNGRVQVKTLFSPFLDLAKILCFLLSATRAFSSFSVSCSCVLVVGECLRLIVAHVPNINWSHWCCHLDHQAFFSRVWSMTLQLGGPQRAYKGSPNSVSKITSIPSTKNEPKTSPLDLLLLAINNLFLSVLLMKRGPVFPKPAIDALVLSTFNTSLIYCLVI